jgi:hypothetical protein
VSGLPRHLLRLEGLAVAGGAIALYFHFGYGWILLVALALAPDLALIGYAFGARTGALAYDLLHTEIWPIGLAVGGAIGGEPRLTQAGLIWLLHIGADRLLGYGLKYPVDSPKNTHLQRV